MLSILIALLSPAVQLGTSYYASLGTVILLLSLVAWARPLAAGLGRASLFLIVIVFMPLSMAGAGSVDPTSDWLHMAREAVMLMILLSAVMGFDPNGRKLAVPPIVLLAGLSAMYLLLAIMQTRAYAQGAYLGFPREWFAQESNTIASDAALIYLSDVLRPQATFSEPSYFGFMLLSIALMVIPRFGRSKLANTTLAMVLIAGLLSRSLSFFLSIFLVILLPMVLERGRNRIGLIAAMLVVVVPVLAFSGKNVLSRVSTATSIQSADASTADRIFGPLYALPGYLAQNPGGSPISVVDRLLVPFLSDRTADASDILNNALFNLIFVYGVVGIAIIAVILLAPRDLRVRLYLLTCAMFNGAFLAIDKVSIICLTLAVYAASRRWAAEFALDEGDGTAPRPVARRVVPSRVANPTLGPG